MLLVDDRAGSKELIKPLTTLGLPVESTRLSFGDLAFEGRGVGGDSLAIGIEHKTVSDLTNALKTQRLQGFQLPGMLSTYDRAWLIVEGDWQRDAEGRVSVWKSRGKRRPLRGALPAIELLKRMLTLTTRGGLYVWPTPNRRATLDFVCALYRFWTDKDLDDHKAHLGVYAPDIDNGLKLPKSEFRAAIQVLLPGIGHAASKTIEQWVWDANKGGPSWRRLLSKTVEEWAALEIRDKSGKPKRLGKKRAEKIVGVLR